MRAAQRGTTRVLSERIRFQEPALPSLAEVQPFFAEAERARWFSNGGPCVRRLERECADYLGLEHAGVAVNNATSGLLVALRACFGSPDPARRLVAVPSFTFVASVNAIIWAGFEPVFVDIDPQDWHLSETSLERLSRLGGSLAGVLQCSTFGSAPSAERRRSLSAATDALGVPVVVDSAAGFGSVDARGHHLGDQGDAEVFSFHATKPFAIGEGGLVTARSQDVLRTVAELTNFGFDQSRDVPGHPGINAKMPELSAAVGLAVLRRFDSILESRRNAAAWLREEVRGTGVTFQSGAARSSYQFLPVAMPTPAARDRLVANAADALIEVRAYFDPPTHRLRPFLSTAATDDLAATESLSGRIVGLPMSNDISRWDLERIRDLVLGAVRIPAAAAGRARHTADSQCVAPVQPAVPGPRPAPPTTATVAVMEGQTVALSNPAARSAS